MQSIAVCWSVWCSRFADRRQLGDDATAEFVLWKMACYYVNDVKYIAYSAGQPRCCQAYRRPGLSPTGSRRRIRSGPVIKCPLAVPARVAPNRSTPSIPDTAIPLLRSPTGTRKVRPLVAIVLSPWLYLSGRKCPLIADGPPNWKSELPVRERTLDRSGNKAP